MGGAHLSMAQKTLYHLVSEIQRYPPFTEEVMYVIVDTYSSLYLEYPLLPVHVQYYLPSGLSVGIIISAWKAYPAVLEMAC